MIWECSGKSQNMTVLYFIFETGKITSAILCVTFYFFMIILYMINMCIQKSKKSQLIIIQVCGCQFLSDHQHTHSHTHKIYIFIYIIFICFKHNNDDNNIYYMYTHKIFFVFVLINQ